MSYSRFIPNDVYVFLNAGSGNLDCCGCSLIAMDAPLEMEGASFSARSTQEMIDHLEEHKKLNHRMPEDIYDRLREDDAENFG